MCATDILFCLLSTYPFMDCPRYKSLVSISVTLFETFLYNPLPLSKIFGFNIHKWKMEGCFLWRP